MKQIPQAVADFFRHQGFVIISSLDQRGFPHNSCKDVVKVDLRGEIYMIDAYYGITGENIKRDPRVSVSAVDERKFMGFCLKGVARLVDGKEIGGDFIKSWEDNITSRLASRLLHNLAGDKPHAHHPEASLPRPKQLIIVTAEEIVDLAPHYLRKE